MWRSPCGAPLVPVWPDLRRSAIATADRSVWRYRSWLPLPESTRPITLGEGGTPLVPAAIGGRQVLFKMEFLQPTGSFKDRGSSVLAAVLSGAGVKRAVEDSSGNAGASLAAYLARAGISLRLYVPASTPPVRVAQAVACGARVDATAVSRTEATIKAVRAARGSRVYASHAYSPYFLAGQATLAFELFEDLGGRLPDAVVAPVGHGVLLLGLYHGFRQLVRAGLAAPMPRLFGVQASACSPIAGAWRRGAEEARDGARRPTRAVGIGVSDPPRSREVLRAVRDTGGAMTTVAERELVRAQRRLARLGWYVEAASAAPVAALSDLVPLLGSSEVIVVPLTGSGLKG